MISIYRKKLKETRRNIARVCHVYDPTMEPYLRPVYIVRYQNVPYVYALCGFRSAVASQHLFRSTAYQRPPHFISFLYFGSINGDAEVNKKLPEKTRSTLTRLYKV